MTGSETPLADYLYERLAPPRSEGLGSSLSDHLYIAGGTTLEPDLPAQRTESSASESGLTERKRRFPELFADGEGSETTTEQPPEPER
jgi:hypothetical protein